MQDTKKKKMSNDPNTGSHLAEIVDQFQYLFSHKNNMHIILGKLR